MDTLAVGIPVGLALLAFLRAATVAARRDSPTTDPDSGTLAFHYTFWLRWGSVGFAAGLLAAVTFLVVVHPPEEDEAVYVALSYALFGSLGAVLVWDVFRFRLEVGSEGLDRRSAWRRRRFVRWEEVVDVSFNGPHGWFEVRTTDGQKVRVPALIGGLGDFLAACERRLTPAQLEPARTAYIYLGRVFPGE